MGKRKYREGIRIQSLSQFESCESQWFMWNGATRHRSVLENQRYKTLVSVIYGGGLYTAERIENDS